MFLYVDAERILARWSEHFKQLLNQEGGARLDVFMAKFLPAQRPVCCSDALAGPFSEKEFDAVLDPAPEGKATGADRVPNEAYKYGLGSAERVAFRQGFNDMLSTGVVPSRMKDVVISTLYKKGDAKICDNYRGLSLINHEGKLLERLILNRLAEYTASKEGEGIIPNSQFGFCPGKSTVDAVWISKMLGYSAVHKGQQLLKCFVDLTKRTTA